MLKEVRQTEKETNAGQTGDTCRNRTALSSGCPGGTSPPVDRALLKGSFEVDLCKKCATPSCDFHCFVDCSIAESNGLGSMWSLMLRPSGSKRWVITRHEPSFFGSTPKPEQWNREKGGCGM